MSNDELLHKWINDEISPAELAKFKQQPVYEELTKIYQLTEHLSVPAIDKPAMLRSILADREKAMPQSQARILSINRYVKYAVAACLLILSVVFLFRSVEDKTLIVEYGNKLSQFLPDQSKVTLNSGSQIAYKEADWQDNRRLHLSGEAFFEVKKGSRFLVQTDFGSVQVLGTSFNVFARGNVLEVACQTGKVAVLKSSGEEITVLNPTEVVRVEEGQITNRWELPIADVGHWVQGLSKFKNVPLANVLSELERQFDISIEATSIDTSVLVSCNFQHENLELALKTALGQLSINYEIKANKVILRQ